MERYIKNELVSFVSKEGVEKFQNAKVLILGAGGVGVNLIIDLAALGIGHLGVVDNDVVEIRNIGIQPLYCENDAGRYKVDVAKEWVQKYNPHIEFKTYNLRLNENNYKEIFDNYDILVDAFDTQESVWMLHKLAYKENKPIVYTGTNEMECFVSTVIPKKTPCFHCYLEHQIKHEPKPYGVFQATGAIAAGLQTMEVIKLILGKGNIVHTNPLCIEGFLGSCARPPVYKSKTRTCSVCGLPLLSFRPFNEEAEKNSYLFCN